MRKICVITYFILLCSIGPLIAQDHIVKTNGEDFNAKVVDINAIEVKYKLAQSADTMLKTLPKSDIFYIQYASGIKEVFNKAIPAFPRVSGRVSQPTYIPIRYERRKYYQGLDRIGEPQMIKLVHDDRGNPNTYKALINGIKSRKVGRFMIFMPGIPLVALGIFETVSGLSSGIGGGYIFLGIGTMATGVAFVIGGVEWQKRGKAKINFAVEQYNVNAAKKNAH